MSAIPWMIISLGAILLVLVILFALIFVKGKKAKKPATDYYAFFVMGITWLPMGIAFRLIFPETLVGYFFISLGIIYTILGFVHRKEWKKNHKTWKQLSKQEKNFKIIILIILGLLVLGGLVAFYLVI